MTLWRPGHLKPMLAQPRAAPFDHPDYLFEVKWDGYRCLAFIDPFGRQPVFLQSRNGHDLSGVVPELADPLVWPRRRAIFDGELVALHEGAPSFAALQQRLQAAFGRGGMAAPPRNATVHFVAFDLLYLDGEERIQKPCRIRREQLQALCGQADSPWLQVSQSVDGEGKALYRDAVAAGLEGIVAKLQQSPYRPGIRSRNWLKIRRRQTREAVIGGLTAGGHHGVGALLLGAYDQEGRLQYLGKVGTGFDEPALRRILVTAKARAGSPFPDAIPRSGFVRRTGGRDDVLWLEPVLVCTVAYHGHTEHGLLRQPVFVALRPDVDPKACRLDSPPAGEVAVDAGQASR